MPPPPVAGAPVGGSGLNVLGVCRGWLAVDVTLGEAGAECLVVGFGEAVAGVVGEDDALAVWLGEDDALGV